MASLTPIVATGFTGKCTARSGANAIITAAGPFIHLYTIAADTDGSPEVFVRAEGPVLALAGCVGSDRVVYVRDDDEGVPEICIVSLNSDDTKFITRQDDPDLVAYDSIALSADGTRLVTADTSPSSVVIVWDLTTPEPVEIKRKALPTAGPYQVSVCPENHDQFAAVSAEHILKFQLEFCGELTALTHTETRVQVSTRITRRGSLLGKLGRRNSVTSMLHLDKYIHKGRTNSITAHCWADGGEIYVGTNDGVLYITEQGKASARELRGFLIQNLGPVASIVKLASGVLVVAGQNSTARWVDPSDGFDVIRELEFPGQPTLITPAPLGGDENDVVACGNGFAKLTRGAESQSIAANLCGNTTVVGICGTTALGQVAVALSSDGAGCIWDCANGAPRGSIVPANNDDESRVVTAMSCSPVSGLMLVGWSDGSLTGYNVITETGAAVELFTLPVLATAVKFIAIDDNAAMFCVVEDGQMVLFDCAHLVPLGSYLFEGAALAISFETSNGGNHRIGLLHEHEGSKTLTGIMLPNSIDLIPKSLETIVHKSVPAAKGAVAVTVSWNSVLVHMRRDDVVVLDWSTFEPMANGGDRLPGHIFAADVHAASTAGRVVATTGSDGVVLARFLRDPQSVVEPAVGIGHRPALIESATCGVAISNDGLFVMSVGGDGEVILWAWTAALDSETSASVDLREIIRMNGLKAVPLPEIRGAHHANDIAVYMGSADEKSLTSSDATDTEKTKALKRKIAKLRAKVMALVDQNEKKPDLEQLEREDFQLDLVEQRRLVAEGEAEMVALKDSIELKILAQQFLRNRIKKTCWDAMEVRGLAVYTYDGNLEVSNYPLPKRSKREIHELRKVQFARKVELEVARRTRPAVGHDEDEEDNDDLLMYSHLELRSDIKKRCQVVLYRESILQIKKAFNQVLEDVVADKLTESEKVRRKNEEIRKVVAEMKMGGTEVDVELFEPTSQPLETPDDLLTVKDEEVQVPRILNDAELADAQVLERQAEERRKLAELDDPRERGLVDMMDGKLEGKGLEEIWQDLPEPGWMTQIPSEAWTDAQKFTAEKYRAEVAEREDMREKRRKALHTDLGNLQDAVKTARKNFDNRVEGLFLNKIRTQQKVLQLELKIVLLLRSLQYESNELGSERDLVRDLEKVKDALPNAAQQREQATATLESFRAGHAALDKADKLLERRFKLKLKDIPEAKLNADHLLRLFKKRRRSSISINPLTYETLAPPLNPEVDRPEGLSDDVWDRIVELREEKLRSELEVNHSATELAHRDAFFARREAEEGALTSQVESILDELDASRQKRFEGATDVEILVPVKQGQMEVIHASDFEPNYENTVLIPSGMVEALNNQVVALGDIKVEHLKSVMQLRTAVHVLEWENNRLKMAAEDHTANTKAVQLLRVTKDLVRDEGVSLAERHRRENEVLEKSIEKLRTALEKTVRQRKKTVRDIQAKRKTLTREEDDLKPGYEDLRVAVQEREVVHKVFLANRGPDLVRQRLKDAALKRRLKNTVMSQDDEIQMLESELERLRMRTFPAFAPGQRAPF